ncbi:hypothetical protein LUZ61_009321 [Rhynchospora tenuis]|uniref:PGG domain-containing protein n=1 Tax=Rhynchospora tenuis TaxID=198213 RepID=A0AAD5ZX01_9POAL|nr:hypothetical protein LUZ61_009321 [Rhynchospora tenuis]
MDEGNVTPQTSQESLLQAAMRREWKWVLNVYKNLKDVRSQTITPANDTMLHVAVSAAPINIVLKLLETVKNSSEQEIKIILGSKNKYGDTPLHLAAALGMDKICMEISSMRPEMVVDARNSLNETPLLTAVRHGKKEAFFVLEHAIHKHHKLTNDINCLNERDITHSRGFDGNHIIHYAIKGEHFDLAYEIIHLYPKLVNACNLNGESALHILASMPSVFESGKSFGLIDEFIYKCQDTKPLESKFCHKDNIQHDNQLGILKDENEALPSTCKVCVDLCHLIIATCQTVASTLKTGICKTCYADDEENQSGPQKEDESISRENQQEQTRRIPRNYDVAFFFFKGLGSKFIVQVLGLGFGRVQESAKLKQKHREAREIMEKLVEKTTFTVYDDGGRGGTKPTDTSGLETLVGPHSELPPELKNNYSGLQGKQTNSTSIVEHRQINVYKFMLQFPTMKENVFGKVDEKGNSVLHLAAEFNHPHTNMRAAASQMQREIKWYKYVAASLDREILATINLDGKTAEEVFTMTHDTQFKECREWLNDAANSFSVVIALIVTVAYTAFSAVPGGFDGNSGLPIFQSYPQFQVFTQASLIALCFSVAALITFLGIIIRPCEIWDFEKVIPLKLIFGFTCSIISIVAMIVSFCAGHTLTVDGSLLTSAYVLYGVLCIPVFLSLKWLSNLYTSLLVTTFSEVPSFR